MRHITDERLEQRLPSELLAGRPTLVYPSVHRGRDSGRCFTVHPLGNPGASAPLGGAPGRFTPAAPRLMTAALRGLAEIGRPLGIPASFEATHHGPLGELPAFFAEIGVGEDESPPPDSVAVLGQILLRLEEAAEDRIAVGAGGGHYAPHFTDLAIDRRWAFGHILSRYALGSADASAVREAYERSGGSSGVLFHRAADRTATSTLRDYPILSESDAARRVIG